MANQALYRAEAGSNRGLDATFGFDWSPDDVNRLNSQITAGVRYNGPIASRPQDMVSFGFVYSKIADPFQTLPVGPGLTNLRAEKPPQSLPTLGSEKAIEVNYAAHLTRYFFVQPVFQYYVDVGGNSRIPNAAVFGFRTGLNF